MRFIDLVIMCLKNLFRRKVRTTLTVLGVVIGTASIVVMMSLGVGLDRNFEADMAEYMDVTSITVHAPSEDKKVKLDDKNVEKIAKLENVETVTPFMTLYDVATISCGRYNYNGTIMAMDLNKMEMLGYKAVEGSIIEKGAPLNGIYFGYGADYALVDPNTGEVPEFEMDEDYKYVDPPLVDVMTQPVSIAVIKNNAAVAEDSGSSETGMASGNENSGDSEGSEKALGQAQPLNVLGKLEMDYSKEGSYYSVVIPLELGKQLQKEYNSLNGIISQDNAYTNIYVKVNDLANVPAVEEEIQSMGFQTESAQEFREAMSQQANLIQVILGGLGAISLFVAALGITNTMIMSIYERTREIGVMKVLGCRLRDIRLMFLLEAGGIGFLGGVVGIIFSYILSFIINMVVGSMEGMNFYTGISVIPLWLVLLGMGFAVGVGLIAGFTPANRAVKISPLAAIRQDQ
ncbi:MAG: ABC transporter permease [Bacillota bacterium]|nr:ABC transporter permease [Bacillota bacterium]